jgi:neutral trehalase
VRTRRHSHPGPLRVRVAEVSPSLDTNRSGHVTLADLPADGGKLKLRAQSARGSHVTLEFDEHNLGLAARIHEYTKYHAAQAGETLLIPREILAETPTSRALLAADSYDSSMRTMDPHRLLEMLVENPDPKVGTFRRGLRNADGTFRTYRLVERGDLIERQATYDGSKLYLYVPANEAKVIEILERIRRSKEMFENVEILPFSPGAMGSTTRRLEARFDRPGILWVSTRCPLLPEIHDDNLIVPGARFGVEAYYHDARINAPGARSTIEALLAKGDRPSREEALKVLSAIRGTTNLFINQINSLGKALNANLTVYAGRTQPPSLTTCIKEVYAAWCKVHEGDPAQLRAAKKWLAWATESAIREYENVWTSPPRIDQETGLSRYVDETPGESPEEEPHYYADYQWTAEDIRADGAIRESGWDSHVGALALVGPDRGRPRQHRMLPICLNSVLFKYERDIAEFERELGRIDRAPAWEARAETRKQTIDRLMWDDETGLYSDLIAVGVEDGKTKYERNGYEDLRALMPMWAGIVEPGSGRAARLVARLADFERKGGLAAATERSWAEARALNPSFVDRCQWGHKDIGWPITTYEIVTGLRRVGAKDKANETAYRWCWMVQREMERSGGLQYSARGGYEAPIMEKMDVTCLMHGGVAEVGYGNQGAGKEGEGSGFRWGYDAFKLLARSLPPRMKAALAKQIDPDLLFSEDMKLARYRR